MTITAMLLSTVAATLMLYSLTHNDQTRHEMAGSGSRRKHRQKHPFGRLFRRPHADLRTHPQPLRYVRQHFGPLLGPIIAVQVVVGHFLNTEGAIGYLPIVASASFTLTVMLTKSATALKTVLVANQLTWSVYNLVLGDWVGVASNTGMAMFTLYTVVRADRSQRGKTYDSKIT